MRWYLQPNEDESYFRIQKKGSNLVLMPTGSGTAVGTRIVLGAINNSDDSQWWNLRRQLNESFTIINKLGSLALALNNDTTASGTGIVLAALTSNSRFWKISGNVPLEDIPLDDVTPITTQIATPQIRIQTTSNAILLENLPKNSKVQVYNLYGKLVYSQFSILNSQLIEVQTKGMYIVKIGHQTLRVTVR